MVADKFLNIKISRITNSINTLKEKKKCIIDRIRFENINSKINASNCLEVETQ